MYLSLFTLCLIFEVLHAKKNELRCKGKILLPEKSTYRANAKKIVYETENMQIPDKFDARLKWPNCKSIRRIQDQEECGGCWAFSSASVIADRICIASEGKHDLDISIQDLLECCTNCTSNEEESEYPGCTDGYSYKAFEWFIKNGIVTGGHEGCKPLEESVASGQYRVGCVEECSNHQYSISYNEDKWYGKEWLFLDLPEAEDSLKNIQAELMTNGPMIATFNLFRYMNELPPGSIIRYNESLLQPNEEPLLHGVKLIGWSIKEDGTHVWIIANSWGEGWCNGGFCNIESKHDGLMFQAHTMTTVVPKIKIYEKKNKDKNPTHSEKKDDHEHVATETNGSNIFFRTHGLSILTLVILFPKIQLSK